MSIIGDVLSFGLGAANLGYTVSANKQQRADQMYFYQNTLPAAQMALRRAAGLNPYGDISQVGANTPTPVNMADNVSNGFQMMQDSLNNARQYRLDKLAASINFKRLLLEDKRLNKDIEVADAQIENLRAQNTNLGKQGELLDANVLNVSANTALTKAKTELQELENEVQTAIKENRITLSNYEVQTAFENLQQLLTNNKYLPLILQATVNKTDAERKKLLSDIDVNNEMINKLKEEVKRMGFDNAAIDQLDKIADSLGDNQSFLKAIISFIKLIIQNK